MQTRPPKRAINGVLILNKAAGYSSNQALQKARGLFSAAKAGHTGNLDPLATGVLPLCFGEATKFSQFLLDSDKGYRATITFGRRSDTGDSQGNLLSDDGAAGIDRKKIEALLPRFRGGIEQIPPMYSALKHQGQPLYKLAREGIEIERAPRKVQIYRLEVIDCRPREKWLDVDVEVDCSKGTYIRSLAMDLGELLGCGGLISALHRYRSGHFDESCSIQIADLEEERGSASGEVLDHHLLPMETLVSDLQKIRLTEDSGYYLQQGQPVLVPSALKHTAVEEQVAVFSAHDVFLGVAEILPDGRVAPRRLVVR